MKPIENVAIVGFGSLGAMYAGCFGAAMGPERVFVVADTARTERYRAEAATFNGEPIRVTYLTYDEAAERAAEEPFDVVLYAVKYGALPEAIINQILDFRKVENGRMELHLEPFDLLMHKFRWIVSMERN